MERDPFLFQALFSGNPCRNPEKSRRQGETGLLPNSLLKKSLSGRAFKNFKCKARKKFKLGA
jgi:hypothetical protein